jgi:hypothetical protein
VMWPYSQLRIGRPPNTGKQEMSLASPSAGADAPLKAGAIFMYSRARG